MFGAYTPDPDKYPQQWPPVAMVRFARSTPHLPLVEWLRPRRRHSRGLVLFRWIAVLAVAALILSRCGGLA